MEHSCCSLIALSVRVFRRRGRSGALASHRAAPRISASRTRARQLLWPGGSGGRSPKLRVRVLSCYSLSPSVARNELPAARHPHCLLIFGQLPRCSRWRIDFRYLHSTAARPLACSLTAAMSVRSLLSYHRSSRSSRSRSLKPVYAGQAVIRALSIDPATLNRAAHKWLYCRFVR